MQISLAHFVVQPATLDSYEKGKLFENFIIQLFSQERFTVKKWRKSERLEDKILLQDWTNPDLELIFSRSKDHHFAMECKWRQKFSNGKITWATENQICAYQSFESQCRIPVFIAIGIGGKPSMPDKLFVTPLRNIEMNSSVNEVDLIPFKKRPTSRFFYDTVQLKLF